MPHNGNQRQNGLDDLDHVCFHCPAPDCIETWQCCPLVRLRKVRVLEGQSGDLVAAASTFYLALLTGEDARVLRLRAERGELGPVRRWGKFRCVPVGEALHRDGGGDEENGRAQPQF